MIEWKNDEVSVDGQWAIQTERLNHEPVWRYFMTMPPEVRQYVDDHPGDTDAWLGHYSVSFREMHAQAERLLEIVANPTKPRRRAKKGV